MNSFNKRNPIKQKLDTLLPKFHIHEREVWYVHLWVNIGFEQDWKWDWFVRPVIVMKKIWNMFFVLPMTTKWKDTRYYFTLPDEYSKQKSRIILSQWRMLDKNRFIDKVCMIHKHDFNIIKEKLKELLL